MSPAQWCILAALVSRYLPQLFLDWRNWHRPVEANCAPNISANVTTLLWCLLVIPGVIQRQNSSFVVSTAVAIVCTGCGIGLVGLLHLGVNYWREVGLLRGHQLVTRGIYSVVRHPIRLGVAIETFGFLLLSHQTALVAVYLAFVWCLLLRTRVEEAMLIRRFPDDALTYQKAVPGFNLVAGLWRWSRRAVMKEPELSVN